MTDEQKQIEEIARVMCINSKAFTCKACNWGAEPDCLDYKNAKTLFEQGYRKVPENAVVLSEEELRQMVRARTKCVDNKAISVRKETAREIIEMLIPDCEVCDKEWYKGCKCFREKLAEKIAKQYGVEIEE